MLVRLRQQVRDRKRAGIPHRAVNMTLKQNAEKHHTRGIYYLLPLNARLKCCRSPAVYYFAQKCTLPVAFETRGSLSSFLRPIVSTTFPPRPLPFVLARNRLHDEEAPASLLLAVMRGKRVISLDERAVVRPAQKHERRFSKELKRSAMLGARDDQTGPPVRRRGPCFHPSAVAVLSFGSAFIPRSPLARLSDHIASSSSSPGRSTACSIPR